MGEVAEFRPSGAIQSAAHIRDQVNRVQEVMKSVMKKETHYGVIPGTNKPTLYKAGSEVLLSMFRIAVSVQIEDLSNDDCIRYRVRTIGTHQTTGIIVGEGIGECSSNEEKYKWRKAAKSEFAATPEARRRIKYGYDRRERREYEITQVRAEPADVANTVLKMAKKRAQIDLTLTATAASDIFTQDIEDLPEEMREQLAEEDRGTGRPPAEKPAYPPASIEKNRDAWERLIAEGKKTAAQVIAMIETKATLSDEQKKQIRALEPTKGATDENA